IYAVRAVLRTGAVDGVLHLGPRPTFPGATPTVEVFLLDWTGDLYGRQIRIDVCARLRDVLRFDDVDALVAAMHADVEAARRLFATGAGACGIRPLPLP